MNNNERAAKSHQDTPATLPTPKQRQGNKSSRDQVYPYYAAFSTYFAEHVMSRLVRLDCANVFDPWNGSGTTTLAALNAGLQSVGTDINPVMIIASKAKLCPKIAAQEQIARARKALDRLKQKTTQTTYARDPLLLWFHPSSVKLLRAAFSKKQPRQLSIIKYPRQIMVHLPIYM